MGANSLGAAQMQVGVPNAHDAVNAANVYSKSQKGAIIIAVLGADYTGPIVEALADNHLRSFVAAMQTIQFIARPVLLATIAEFITSMQERGGGIQGGEKQARALAETLLSTERTKRIFGGGQDGDFDKSDDIWRAVGKQQPARLAAYLDTLRHELVSFVLTKVSSVKAGEILAELSDDMAGLTARHMSKNVQYDTDIQKAISELLRIEFLEKKETDEGSHIASFMADVLGVLPKARRDQLMDIISKDNPDTADKIRKGLLTFEDLPKRLPKTAIPLIFRDMEAKELLAALKAGQDAEPETTAFLYANISQRMAEQYKEQVDELAGLSEKEADKAIIALMSFISRQEKTGVIAYIDVAEPDEA